MKKIPILNLALFVAGITAALACAEVGLRLVWPVSQGYYLGPAHTETRLTPDPLNMPGVSGPAFVRTVDWGIRADSLSDDPSQFRILAIGGSTTANLYLDTPETWTGVLQARLRAARPDQSVWIGNAGRSGANVRDHVIHLKYLAPQVPGLDAVTVLAGINDMSTALSMDPYRSPPPITDADAERETVSRAFTRQPGRLHRTNTLTMRGVPYYKRTALYELARRVHRAWMARRTNLAQDAVGAVYETWRSHRRGASRYIDVLPRLDAALDDYRSTLEQIVRLAREQRLRLVFMTQPALFRADLSPAEERLLWLGGIGNFQEDSGLAYYTAGALRRALDEFNRVMLAVCNDHGVTCFDLAAHVPRSDSVFFDDAHFTELGSRLVGEAVADFILSQDSLNLHP